MGAKLTLEGTSSGAVTAVKELQGAVEKVEKGFSLTAREAKKLEDAAARMVKSNQTPLERYNTELAKAQNYLSKELITTEDLARQKTKLTLEYIRQTDGMKKQKEVMDLGATSAKKLGDNIEESGKKGHGAGEGMSHLVAHFTRFYSVTAVIEKITEAFQAMGEVANAAGERMVRSISGVGQLAQIAATPAEREEMKTEAEGFVSRGISTDMNQATNLIFQMRASGLNKGERGNVASLVETGTISQENAIDTAKAVGKYRNAFGGTIEGALDELMQTAQPTSSNLTGVATATLNYGPQAKQMGFNRFESDAALVVLEKVSKDVEVASNEYGALLSAAQKKNIKAGSVEELIGKIDKQIETTHKTPIQLLGRKEAAAAYTNLKAGMTDFEAQKTLIQSADARNFATTQSLMNVNDPQLAAALGLRAQTGANEISEEQMFGTVRDLGKGMELARLNKKGGLAWMGEYMAQKTVGKFVPWRTIVNRWEDQMTDVSQQEAMRDYGFTPQLFHAMRLDMEQRDPENAAEIRKQTAILEAIRDNQQRPAPAQPTGRQE